MRKEIAVTIELILCCMLTGFFATIAVMTADANNPIIHAIAIGLSIVFGLLTVYRMLVETRKP